MDWKKKLTSRKLWTAVASFVALIVIAFGFPQATATQVTALIMAGATVIGYIVGEGLVDAAAVQPEPSASAKVADNAVAKTAGDIAAAAQAVKRLAEDVSPSDSKAIETCKSSDVKVADDSAKAAEMSSETSETVSK